MRRLLLAALLSCLPLAANAIEDPFRNYRPGLNRDVWFLGDSTCLRIFHGFHSRAYSASSCANVPSANLAAPPAHSAPRCQPAEYPLRGDAHFAASGGSAWLSTFWLGVGGGVGATLVSPPRKSGLAVSPESAGRGTVN